MKEDKPKTTNNKEEISTGGPQKKQKINSSKLKTYQINEEEDISDLILSDSIQTYNIISRGLSYNSFERISGQAPFSLAFWAEALGLSSKSLNRYKQSGKKFRPLQSEKIIEIAEVLTLGKKVFDNDEDFELWLNAPSLALGNNKPIDLIKNSYGKELVITELTNIDQGIFV